ncbi:kelch-like protein 40b [Sinocyclocheilus anshuiensis]|uniref:Protein-cysteine N-palmitoyltransferase HHAT-like protein n=1 Tax=Sinocyclocheilus anshuiensis TaxID=1608454 RepID=A0A671RHM5_9TELE|nr:PREDICTED: kelch-like protein 40b [Sinocyclocheilus anshuiensis]
MALPIDPMEEPRMYQQTLLQDGLYDLLESDMMVDCVLKIKDKEFPCHRLVLAACSSYFRAFFKSGVEESKQKEIALEDVEPGVMGIILKYLYTSNINVTEQNVQDIFALANMLQIPSIFTVCVSFLQKRLSLSNCLAIFRLGLMLDCPRLAISARNFACERFQLIARDEEFLQLTPSELAAIIASDSLNVETEQDVFEALIKWVGHDQEKRLEDLTGLLDCVRLRLVPEDYFTKNVEKHEWLSSNPEITKKLQLVKDAQAGKLPEVKKTKSKKSAGEEGEKKGDEEEEEEQGELLPGILNDNLRFGMFLRDLIFLINGTASVAYDPTGNDCYVASLSNQIPKNHCSLVTKENQIFVAGGLFFDEQSKDEQIYSYFLQFDPATSDWMGMPPIPSPRFLFSMGEAENFIFVIGGKEMKEGEHILDTVMVYDRQYLKWAESDPLPYPVYGHGVVSHNEMIYVIGGKGENKECLNKVCAYDTKKHQWKDLAPLNTARSLFGVTIHKNKIYVAAGVTDTGLTGSAEVYDIKTNKWSEFVEFPQDRSSLSLVTVGGVLYAVGGFAMFPKEDSDDLMPREMNDIWRYDESERKWNGILREIQYASGATVLGVRLNTLRLTKI